MGDPVTLDAPRTPPRFWDRLARRYASRPVPDEAAYAATLDRVRAHLSPGDRVLELGCGTGTTALKLAPSVLDYLATDYSAEMIAIGEEKARAAAASGVRFLRGTCHDLDLPPGSFDVVTAFNLLHLVEDLPGFFARVRSLLRPGGAFISKTPCIGDRSSALRVIIPVMQAFGVAPYVHFVTRAELDRDLAAAGFDAVETGWYPEHSRAWFVVARSSLVPDV